jgi:hypothetical protein
LPIELVQFTRGPDILRQFPVLDAIGIGVVDRLLALSIFCEVHPSLLKSGLTDASVGLWDIRFQSYSFLISSLFILQSTLLATGETLKNIKVFVLRVTFLVTTMWAV